MSTVNTSGLGQINMAGAVALSRPFDISATKGQTVRIAGRDYVNLGSSAENVAAYGQDIAFQMRSQLAGVNISPTPEMTTLGKLLSWYTTGTVIGSALADVGGAIQGSGLAVASNLSDKLTSQITGEKAILPKDTGFLGESLKTILYLALAFLGGFILLKVLNLLG